MSDSTAQILTIDGLRTACVDAGSGPPVLLLHGAGPGADMELFWAPVLGAFAERFRVIAPDLPGYGESDLLPVRDTPANVALHVWSLLDALGIDEIDVVGHSRGGRVAVEMAAAAPARVPRLAIICSGSTAPQGHLDDDGRWTPSTRAGLTWGTDGGTAYDTFAALYRGFVLDPSHMPDEVLRPRYDRLLAHPTRLQEWVHRMTKDNYLDFYHREDAAAFEEKLRALSMPTMVLVGREDATSAWQRYLPLVDMIADVELHILARLGHFPQLERPAEFLSLTFDFLERPRSPVDQRTGNHPVKESV